MVEIVKLPSAPSGLHQPHLRSALPPLPAAFDPLAMLLVETATGRERAIARLYELMGGRLLSVAHRIVGRRDLAEDVLQESFLRIWRSAHQYDPAKGPAYAWLVSIVRNRALSAKARMARDEGSRSEIDGDRVSFDGPDAADQVVRSEEARRVNACLLNLPLNHRRSVALVYFEGLTHRELAERLGVQLGTAKSWVRRGLAKMGQCLTGQAEPEWRELVAADYAVGCLRGPARRGFERRRERDARYCRPADFWEAKLALLTESLPDSALPPQLWKRIEKEVASNRITFARPLFWQAASAILVAAIAVLLLYFVR